jgi:aspartate 1-decarboxylase
VRLEILKSKIHRATVTGAELNYVGSITVDIALMDAAGLQEYEKVHVFNINNGTRAETYVIHGARNKGEIIMNGALARLAQIGDRVIIVAFGFMDETETTTHKPKIIVVDERNRILQNNKS